MNRAPASGRSLGGRHKQPGPTRPPSGSARALLPRGRTGFIPADRVPQTKLNLRFVLLRLLILEKQQGVDVIHGVVHDPGHLRIGDSGVAGFASTSGGGVPAWRDSIGSLRKARATIAFASLAS